MRIVKNRIDGDTMKKNNKGFAISTVIYGLSIMGILLVAIMMATMSATRTNTSRLSKSIEEELNRINRTEISFAYQVEIKDDGTESDIPEAQPYIVPEGQSGFYRIQLWGTQGGSPDGAGAGGYGAYTSGIIFLKEGQTIYFYVGRHQEYNPGRATEVRLTGGAYGDQHSYVTTIMAAAGGGNAGTAYGGTLYGYNKNMFPLGGSVDTYTATPTYGLVGDGNVTNGTLIGLPGAASGSAYGKTNIVSSNLSNAVSPSGTGGDGYVSSNTNGISGTSYISGYGGVQSWLINGKKQGLANQTTSYNNQTYIYNEETGEESYSTGENRVFFLDGRMYPGVNTGDGKAKIERISVASSIEEKEALKRSDPFKIDKKADGTFVGITSVRDCVDNSQTTIKGVRISVITSGVDKGGYANYSGSPTTVDGRSLKCATLTFTNSNVDEIDIWHVGKTKSQIETSGKENYMPPPDMFDGIDVKNHTVEVKKGSNWYKIKGINTTTYNVNGTSTRSDISETETVDGIRLSAYQANSADKTLKVKNGDYYIMPVTAYGKVLTAPATIEEMNNDLTIEPIMGYKRQKWSIEQITNEKIVSGSEIIYKITEQARYKSLTVANEENLEKNMVNASRSFNNYQRDDAQIWKITPAGDGTYYISLAKPTSLTLNGYTTGNLIAQTNSTQVNFRNKVFIGRNNPITERYKLIAVDYLVPKEGS